MCIFVIKQRSINSRVIIQTLNKYLLEISLLTLAKRKGIVMLRLKCVVVVHRVKSLWLLYSFNFRCHILCLLVIISFMHLHNFILALLFFNLLGNFFLGNHWKELAFFYGFSNGTFRLFRLKILVSLLFLILI